MSKLKLAEFTNQEVEKEYFHSEISRAIPYFRKVVLGFGILNTLFIIPDYFAAGNNSALVHILMNRIIILLLTVIFYLGISRLNNLRLAVSIITAYKFAYAISYLHILSLYENPNYYIKSFDIIIITMIFFVIPNRWIYAAMSSIFLSSSFFFVVYYMNGLIPGELYPGMVYITITSIIIAASSYRTHDYKRQNYQMAKKLQIEAATDPLTGLNNRGKFNKELEKQIEIYRKLQTDFSVILFDLNNFKDINDKYGHIVGDRIIKEASATIKNHLRESDTLSRWGGDEFTILLPNTNKESAQKVVQKIHHALLEHDFNIGVKITGSFGVVSGNDGDNIDSLITRADKLMYKAKESNDYIASGSE